MRIVLVGAGSVEFTRNLLGDFLAYPELRDAQIVLHDIDPERLRTAERMAAWTAEALGAAPRIEGHLDRREALRGADIVVNTIQVGGARATRVDFDVPARYGLRYTINDTINVGGVMRGLRTIPIVLGIVRDMEEVCPDAWFLNYTNPLAMLVRAVAERSSIKTVGLCHSVFWTVDTLAGYLGLPRDEIDHVSAGVNHLAFMLRLEHRGRDLYPDLRAFVAADRVPDDDLVRAELFRRLGFYPTESSEHHAEYNPWFIPKGDSVERFHIPIGEYLDRVANNLEEYAETNRRLDAGESFEIEPKRRVRGRDRAFTAHRPAIAHRGQHAQPWRAHRQPRRGRMRGGPRAGRRHRRLAGRGRRPAAAVRGVHRPCRGHPGAYRPGGTPRGPGCRVPRGDAGPPDPGTPGPRRGLGAHRRAHRGRSGVAAGVAPGLTSDRLRAGTDNPGAWYLTWVRG